MFNQVVMKSATTEVAEDRRLADGGGRQKDGLMMKMTAMSS